MSSEMIRTKLCRGCNKTKATSEFYDHKHSCKECYRTKVRARRKANPEKTRLANAKHKATASRRNRAYITQAKSYPCMDCGIQYPYYVMDFDHVRGNKIIGVGSMTESKFSIEAIQQEIDKCELVCANCHRMRTHNRSTHKTNTIPHNHLHNQTGQRGIVNNQPTCSTS